MGVLNENIRLGASAAGAYEIKRSLRFNKTDDTYLAFTPSSAGTTTAFTISMWVKRSILGTGTQVLFSVGDTNNDRATFYFYNDNLTIESRTAGSAWNLFLRTNSLYRDPSAWYHIVARCNSTNGTANLYVNGVDQTDLSNSDKPSGSQNLTFCEDMVHEIGRRAYDHSGNNTEFEGYITEMHFIDGQALDASNFGESNSTTGAWVAKKYTGSYGTTGFYVNFSDNSNTTSGTLGADSSGNGNNFTPNNFSVSAGVGNDSVTDTPTNNYATLNPVDGYSTLSYEPSNGSLDYNISDTSAIPYSTIAIPTSGKWYAEFTAADIETGCFGFKPIDDFGLFSEGYLYTYHGKIWKDNSETQTVAAISDGDIIGVAVDRTAQTVQFSKNGTNIGSTEALVAGTVYKYWIARYASSGGNPQGSANFGQRAFSHQPSGFGGLCASALPTPTIEKPSDHFDILTYTGNGSTQSITGLSFEPELVWTKERNGSDDHALWDAMRGVQKKYVTHSTADSTTVSDGLTAFVSGSGTSNGFSVGANGVINQSSQNYVAFCWNGGSSAVAETAGSINSSVRANPTAGFSNLSYTGNATAGATVEHGLNAVPQWMIIKRTSDNWILYHHKTTSSPEDDYYEWQSASNLATSGAFMWNNTLPTSTLFTLYSDGAVNASGDTIYWWGWSGVEGFSKFGKYTGNGNANGTMVHTGFKPAFVLTKLSSGHWVLWHNKVEGYNPTRTALLTNANNPEEALDAWAVDFLSNGFKLRGTSVHVNGNGSHFIYMAFAETPFKYATAR